MRHPHDPIAICEALGMLFEHIYPPIPDRRWDWGVYMEGQEEEGMLSYGRTETEAAWDALENYEETI